MFEVELCVRCEYWPVLLHARHRSDTKGYYCLFLALSQHHQHRSCVPLRCLFPHCQPPSLPALRQQPGLCHSRFGPEDSGSGALVLAGLCTGVNLCLCEGFPVARPVSGREQGSTAARAAAPSSHLPSAGLPRSPPSAVWGTFPCCPQQLSGTGVRQAFARHALAIKLHTFTKTYIMWPQSISVISRRSKLGGFICYRNSAEGELGGNCSSSTRREMELSVPQYVASI